MALGTDRRSFLKTSAAAASGLVIAFYVPRAGAQTPKPPALPDPNAFLRIGTDETVTILLAHSEMGQGIWTTLPMLVGEELSLDWTRVRVEHAPAAPAYAHVAFGMQATGGSTTTWSEFDRYRQVGALARELLVQVAAQRWGIPPAECRLDAGHVTDGSRRLSFGALAHDASQRPAPTAVTLKPAAEWTVIGKDRKRLDSPEKVTGKAQFGLDVRFPGLMVALVARAPVFGGTVRRFDDGPARAVPGVKAVVQVPSGVAVVAEHFWAARKGRDALKIEWDEGPGGTLDSTRLLQQFREMAKTDGVRAHAAGDAPAALKAAAKVLDLEYSGPYLSHSPMEPLNCTVRLSPGKCEVWTGTQFQTVDQAAAAEAAGLKPDQVEVHTPFLGGGFGRRANPAADFVREAVHVAKASGMPVKVVWTREDDTHGGYYRPQFLHRARIALGGDGLPAAWRHTIVCQSIIDGTPFAPVMIKDGVDDTSVEGAADSPYFRGTANHLAELHTPKLPVPVLWWRSVGHTHSAFAVESIVDELAHAAGIDPLEYRRRLLAKHPRHLGVLELAAERAGWKTAPPRGRFRGLAVHESFGSFAANVVEISVASNQIRVHRVVSAIDCGVVVNPAGVRAQMEGCAIFGITTALYSELTLRKGRVQQSNFNDYRMLRMPEAPQVEVHIVPSTERSGGVGEPGVPPIAPAIANALFRATGKRLRTLPLRLA
ncbi:MAG TPA: xanthine dehydrogenase family protein molybdopterin-binding subunit [Vicinamibacterales bacterium]|nr:xanthine dehydrogenase family protein molybdopterin-binding subunit [Vicinamibacterales bacterium]